MYRAKVTFLDKFSCKRNCNEFDNFAEEVETEKDFFAFYDETKVVLYNTKSQYVTWIKADDFKKLIENGWVRLNRNWA